MRVVNVAKVVVERPDGRVLLLRRSATDPRRAGQWDFPGGGVDKGESHIQAAVRETREEAGLAIRRLRVLYMATETYKAGNQSVNRVLCHAKINELMAEEVKLSFEHDEAKWVPKQQAVEEFPHPFYGVGLQYAIDHGLI